MRTEEALGIEVVEGELTHEKEARYSSTRVHGHINPVGGGTISSRVTHHEKQSLWVKLDNDKEVFIPSNYQITRMREGHRVRFTHNTWNSKIERIKNITTGEKFSIDTVFPFFYQLKQILLMLTIVWPIMLLPGLNLFVLFLPSRKFLLGFYKDHLKGKLAVLYRAMGIFAVITSMSLYIHFEEDITGSHTIGYATSERVDCDEHYGEQWRKLHDFDRAELKELENSFTKGFWRVTSPSVGCFIDGGETTIGIDDKAALYFGLASYAASLLMGWLYTLIYFSRLNTYLRTLDVLL